LEIIKKKRPKLLFTAIGLFFLKQQFLIKRGNYGTY